MGQGTLGAAIKRQLAYAAALAKNTASSNSLIGLYFTNTGTYPSNTQIWYAGKDSAGDFKSASLDKIGFGNTPAPRGHFILNAFDRDYAAVSGITDPEFIALREQDLTRPSCLESAFGRIFYAGSQDIATQCLVFFSAVINSPADLERCYQVNDPTSEQLSDLLDTDGGVISIANCGKVVALREYKNGVLVFATNGVWHIRSGSDNGFRATAYVVDKITDIGTLGRDSVVSAEGAVFYWSDAGIYAITTDQVGIVVAAPISENTIQTFYNNISDIAKKYCLGRYLSRDKKIIWIYKDDGSPQTSNSQRNKYLEFDLTLRAFTPGKFAEEDGEFPVTIVGIFLKGFFGTTTIDSLILRDFDRVVVGTDPLIVSSEVDASQTSGAKFVGLQYGTFESGGGDGEPWELFYGATFYELTGTDYRDPNGPFEAYAETNNIVIDELMRNKQAQYLFCYFNRTEDGYELDEDNNIILSNQSSCLVQAKWDWTGSGHANRWSTPQQAYRLKYLYIPENVSDPFNYDYDVVDTKLLLRGKGKSLKLRFEAEPGKGFELLGWATPITVYSTP